jgi:subtilisin family serine protease
MKFKFPFRLLFLVLSVSVSAVPPAESAKSKPVLPSAKLKKLAPPVKVAEPALRNWGLDNTEGPSHIEAKKAWKITEGSPKVIVAVIDTGIDFNHPDLKNNLWHKPGSDEFGYDFVFNKKNPIDVNGHGSHIAGIIGASADPGHGVVGVSPHVSIMPLRYFADDNTNTDTVANTVKAVDYAIENGAKIINYSSEGKGFNVAEYRALERAGKHGILVVVAAGNSGENNDTADSPTYPASYDLPNLIAVAATNIHNELLPISNYGATRVHVAAPGESIFSTMPHSRYGYNTGTSQATAFVSGVAALMLSENPNLTPPELKKLIMSSVDKANNLKGKVASGGRLNAYKAVVMAQETLKNAPTRAVATANQ